MFFAIPGHQRQNARLFFRAAKALEGDAGDGMDLDFGDSIDDDATAEVVGLTSTEVLSAEDETLEIGAQTQAGLEAALLEDADERTDASISSEDAPTVEVGTFSQDDVDEADIGELTQESQTLSIPASDEEQTIETPTIEAPSSAEISLTESASDDDLFNDPHLEIARMTTGETTEILIPVEVGSDAQGFKRFKLSIKLNLDAQFFLALPARAAAW